MISDSSWHLFVTSLPLFLRGAINTLLVTIFAFSLGLAGGTLFGILSCRKFKAWWTFPINLYVLVIRGTPAMLQLMLIYFALPTIIGINFSPLIAGIITLGLNSIAYVTEIIRGGINAIHEGQWDASYVLGLSYYETIKAIILPQVFAIVLAPLINETTALIKETSIVSVIGLLELTRIGMNMSAKTLDPIASYGAIALIYFCMTTTISYGAKIIEGRLNHDHGN